MRVLILLLGLVALVASELELADACNEEVCQLPNCRCSSANIPGGLRPRDTPQFVTTTFDDGVNVLNIETYREILYNRANSNGCPIGATFYINHEYTNYQLVNELYNRGYEIALHSVSHQTPQTYWAEATYDVMKSEIGDQKSQMAHLANIPANTIKGVRLPFLQLAGNNSFHVMNDYALQYDCSWTTQNNNPGFWPYTLDYASNQDCNAPPCPTASIPGIWVQPMVSWSDLQGFPCGMADSCAFPPDHQNGTAWFEFILENFERHYNGNRAPFGFYVHEAFIQAWPGLREGYIRFLNLLNELHDVFLVNSSEVIDWTQNPIPINEYRSRPCRVTPPSPCSARTCPLTAAHNNVEYWMAICAPSCPRVYPWLGNPLGA